MSRSGKRFAPSRIAEVLVPIALVLLTLVLITTLVLVGYSIF